MMGWSGAPDTNGRRDVVESLGRKGSSGERKCTMGENPSGVVGEERCRG
jgi:hypothetical protein